MSSERTLIITIDPGKSGAIVMSLGDTVKVLKMPDTIYSINDLFSHTCDYFTSEDHLYNGFSTFDFDREICLIEQIRPMHNPKGAKKGVKQTWSQAENYTALLMALYANSIKTIEVPASKWMAKLPGSRPKEYKERKAWLKQHAQRLYPQQKVTLWNADALCLHHVSGEFI